MPQSWRVRWDAGYFRHLFMDDPAGGARVLLEAAELPDAPYWLRTLAAASEESKAPWRARVLRGSSGSRSTTRPRLR